MCDISKPVYYLIVTLFRRGPSRQDSEYSYRSSGLNQLSTLLNHLLQPSYLALHSIRHNEQRNTSAAYSVITDLLPVNIRANPDLTAFEAAHSVEMVVALYSSKDQHFIDEQPRFDLALFDMDSTLIQQEVIDELARSIGLFPAVSAITARAMNGEIDFETSLRERVALLRGVKTSVWEDLKTGGRITIMKGAKELVGRLRELGARTAVASGGFVPMAEWLKGELGLDYAFANHLETSGPTTDYPYEHLTGNLLPSHPVITPEEKRSILYRLAKDHKVSLSRTLVIGDGSNDLLMMHAAGLGIAWNAKERVQKEAPNRLNGDSLEEICLLLEQRETSRKSDRFVGFPEPEVLV